jgi:hypothetical protein
MEIRVVEAFSLADGGIRQSLTGSG